MAKRPKRPNPQTNLKYWVDKEKYTKYRYTQEWQSYNLAQCSEKLMFLDILRELCAYIVDKKKTDRGRPKTNLQEMVFCMAVVVYCQKSKRRIISELHMAKDRGLISKVPHFNTLIKYFNEKDLTKFLSYLILISALPLQPVEKYFTVDASGFSTSTFHRWFDHKWGQKEKSQRIWRKAHVMSGVKTNIVTSIKITEKRVNDVVKFEELLKETSMSFRIKEVSGDMAYSSRKNLELVSGIGAIPYIPFQSNITGKARGSYVWMRMYQYFKNNYDDFMHHYHKRSNAESVFSMVKRKFSNEIKAKNPVSQENEILAKFLCHNIVVLITECFTLGIETEIKDYSKEVENIRNYLNFCPQNNLICT